MNNVIKDKEAPPFAVRGARSPGIILGGTAVALVACFVLEPGRLGASIVLEEHVGYMLRVTARLAFAAFLVAYAARPILQLTGVGRRLVSNRRFFGLSAALSQTVHFAYVVTYVATTQEAVSWVTLIFGVTGFVFFWAMALTSNDASRRRLGPWWSRLHLTGLHYIWLIFVYTFTMRAISDGHSISAAFASAGFVVLCLRITAYTNAGARRAA